MELAPWELALAAGRAASRVLPALVDEEETFGVPVGVLTAGAAAEARDVVEMVALVPRELATALVA